jgi:hypothetical protein
MILYKEFANKCEPIIEEFFSIKSLIEKAEIIKQGIVKEEEVKEFELSNIELFKVSG